MTPPIDGFDDLDRLRDWLRRLRDEGALHVLLERFGQDEAPSRDLSADVSAQLDRLCRVLDALDVEDWRSPLEVPEPRLAAIAEAAGLDPAAIPPLLGKLVAIARMAGVSRVRTPLGEPGPSASGAPERPVPSPADLIRRIDLFTLLTPTQRADLFFRWDLMARVGRGPEYDRPLFAVWNRNLRLFDALSDPKPAAARGRGGAS
jgi:hypothetical protein